MLAKLALVFFVEYLSHSNTAHFPCFSQLFLDMRVLQGIKAECSATNTVIIVFMETFFDAVMSPVW